MDVGKSVRSFFLLLHTTSGDSEERRVNFRFIVPVCLGWKAWWQKWEVILHSHTRNRDYTGSRGRLYRLKAFSKAPQPSQTVLLAGDQVFKHVSHGETCHIETRSTSDRKKQLEMAAFSTTHAQDRIPHPSVFCQIVCLSRSSCFIGGTNFLPSLYYMPDVVLPSLPNSLLKVVTVRSIFRQENQEDHMTVPRTHSSLFVLEWNCEAGQVCKGPWLVVHCLL